MMPDRRRITLALVTLASLGLTACGDRRDSAIRPEEHGLVCMFPGVGGGKWSQAAACRGLRTAGVKQKIHINEWDTPFVDVLGHLQDIERNRDIAARAAEQIVAYRATYPHTPIDLIGYSAGGGIALLTAEALPTDIELRNVVLVQPGISPTWDLTPTLRRVTSRLINFYCPSDWLILGAGTRTFGTVDRQKVASAGKEGLDLDVAVHDPALRRKVAQVRWTWDMFWSGHIGNHTGILAEAWNRDYVAPYLLPPAAPASQPAPR